MAERVRHSLQDTPAVLVNGPRKCGKTTLAKQFAHGMQYTPSMMQRSLKWHGWTLSANPSG